MHVILTHENADFDAVASLLAAHRLYPDSVPVLPHRVNQNVHAFITLYKNGLPFIPHESWTRRHIRRVTLVDTQRIPSLRGLHETTPIEFIDHHPQNVTLRADDQFQGEPLGANTTLLVEMLQARSKFLSTLDATLLALGIYEDTGSFTSGRTTVRDMQAAAWLIAQGADLDTLRRFLDTPLNEEQERLLETLLQRAESRAIEGHLVIVATAQIDTPIHEINRVVGRLNAILSPSALFVVVSTPRGTHLIGRAASDDVDTGAVARAFGGGGHNRAAAATVSDGSLHEIVESLWILLRQHTRPAVRVSQLMSFGLHTIDANRKIGEIIGELRRIGHEGYPVVEAGQLVGLLTRRDADRAAEHGLGSMIVRDVMQSGTHSVSPDDSIYRLEQLMLQTNWGQIPVISDHKKLIGIVTRTDLIKHWAQAHPGESLPAPHFDTTQFSQVLGSTPASLIQSIAGIAQEQAVSAFMVGGSVRDMLLRRQNLDIDFVVEGDAIGFAHLVSKRLGGEVSSFKPFGTAKWFPPTAGSGQTPHHIDFASARNEFYNHPTALPTVYHGSIKLDLQRRDFTINTLAVEISPAYGRILDFYGGLRDLENHQIRVLHSLSFIDDPTRILRAVRFEQRLGFEIESRTEALIQPALPMLGRITGERVRNELQLLFSEQEPEAGMLKLAQRGILQAIHPALFMDDALALHFRQLRQETEDAALPQLRQPQAYWILIASRLTPSDTLSLCERLHIAGALQTEMQQSAQLSLHYETLRAAALPSAYTAYLEDFAPLIIRVHMLTTDTGLREVLETYLRRWQHIRPMTNGETLKQLGLKPGPCFGQILDRLRAAWLDGIIDQPEQELPFVQRWRDEGLCG